LSHRGGECKALRRLAVEAYMVLPAMRSIVGRTMRPPPLPRSLSQICDRAPARL